MAGDWLKIEANTPDKPEVFEIATRLNISPKEAFACLFLVWRFFDQHTEEGNATNVTSAYLDHITGVTGFAEAMRVTGWLCGGTEGNSVVSLPNFDRHNGKTAKSRALTAKRVAALKKRSANGEVTLPPLPREEKRRSKTPIPPSGGFLKFWSTWPRGPRKKAQGKCWEAWAKRDFDQAATEILSHVEAMKQTEDWRKGFVPMPITYLNQRQWEGAEGTNDTPPESPLYRREGPM